MSALHLMSHELCPYVQRAVILLLEKEARFEKTFIDLERKPDWFLTLSPLGKVPLLKVDDEVLFESTAICEYLDETIGSPLHPRDPITRAKHRAWMEYSSVLLNHLWNLCMSQSETELESRRQELDGRLGILESALGQGPYFTGEAFSLVDTFYGPVFRYFDACDLKRDLKLFEHRDALQRWRRVLMERPSIKAAVAPDFCQKLLSYFALRNSILAS